MIFQIMGDLANPAVDSHFEGVGVLILGGGYLFGILVIRISGVRNIANGGAQWRDRSP